MLRQECFIADLLCLSIMYAVRWVKKEDAKRKMPEWIKIRIIGYFLSDWHILNNMVQIKYINILFVKENIFYRKYGEIAN